MKTRLALLALCGLALGACQSPVRAVRVDRTEAHRDLTRSALTTGEPSWETRDVLIERGLLEAFAERPEAALAALHGALLGVEADPSLLFALAELSFLHGQRGGAARAPAGGGGLRLCVPLPGGGRVAQGCLRPAHAHGGRPLQLGADGRARVGGRRGRGAARRSLRAAVRLDRRRLRLRRDPRRKPRAVRLRSRDGAARRGPRPPLSLARDRRSARGLEPAGGSGGRGRRPGGAAPAGPADRAASHRERARGARRRSSPSRARSSCTSRGRATRSRSPARAFRWSASRPRRWR